MAAPVVPTAECASSMFFRSATGCFDSTDRRLQDTNARGSTKAVAQAVLRNRFGYINYLCPAHRFAAAVIDSRSLKGGQRLYRALGDAAFHGVRDLQAAAKWQRKLSPVQ